MTLLPGPETARIRKHVPGSVSASVVLLGEREVVLVRSDPADTSAYVGAADGDTFASAAKIALDLRVPLVGVVANTGASMADGGMSALHSWGVAARALARAAGVVPTIAVVSSPAVSGLATLLGLVDVVIMVGDALAYVSGPRMVRDFTGVPVEASELGGATTHARRTGVAAFVVPDEAAAFELITELLTYLPDHTDEAAPRLGSSERTDSPSRVSPDIGDIIPAVATGSYDVRGVVREVVDEDSFLEIRSAFAPNLVTAFARIDGRPVGIVANQPQAVAGTLDIPSSQKGAGFVSFCDTFNLPIITFVDTPGFYPGKDLEWRGMIRHGAQLAFAYAEATVPRICVVLRKAYGGAYIVMDCKSMGNDLCIAWPSAEVAVMGAQGAVQILHRGKSAEERAALVADYEATLLTPYVAAERGYVDMVIEPSETRPTIVRALDLLVAKREKFRAKKHSNTPL